MDLKSNLLKTKIAMFDKMDLKSESQKETERHCMDIP